MKAVAFSEDDLNLTVAASNSTVGVWSLQTKHEIATLDDQPSDGTTVAISPDSKRFVSQGSYGISLSILLMGEESIVSIEFIAAFNYGT